ncbi:MAG: UvrD-helicase domain-containing protein [Muribaculaceae bacterium]|jgi:DNA helicase-2/ATP-dependent DNA helicase PcrA|nr:UvrD-helicase domain-containing protein [Muribaculaceae bacterium]
MDCDSSYLCELNEAQRAAVEYLGGPELVIAGAGSGKTRVLTYKIVHLLQNGHRPGHLLALTFTNKAANEMRERIDKLVGSETAARLWMGTFHSIFSRILRRHADRIGFKSNFTVYDAADSKSLIKSIIKEMKLDDKIYTPSKVASDISFAKNNLYSPEDYAADKALIQADANAKRSRLVDIFKVYRDRCRIAGAMDFDDLLFYTNVLLRDNADIREYYQQHFSYILVDEYQDTNFAQHMIVLQLCGEHNNMCVVGDDAQSIYSFRGANIRNILNLKQAFPALRTFKLEENYRSTQNIIGAANSLIAVNKEQIPKEVFSNNSPGDLIEAVQSYNDYEEAYLVASRISQVRMRRHLPYNEIAILYRTNAQSRVIEEALRNRNIPYRIYGGLSFYQRKEIKDAISYFRLAVNPDDDEAFRRVINTPKRGIGETTVSKIMQTAIGAEVSLMRVSLEPTRYNLSVNSGTARKLRDFADMVVSFNKEAQEKSASELARDILSRTGLAAQYISDSTPENVSKHENILELVKGADIFTDRATSEGGPENAGMSQYLAEISLLTDQDSNNEDGDCVTLMTIHSAKGLEFGAVFVVGVEEEIIPSVKSRFSPAQIEEERRLMYVAITRAKQFCMLSYAGKRMINGQQMSTVPSRFLRDISPEYLRKMTGSTFDGAPVSRDQFNRQHHSFSAASPSTYRSNTEVSHVESRPTAAPKAPAPATAGGHTTHMADELVVGLRIEHPTFGLGVISHIDTSRPDHRISVDFSGDGSHRTLLLKFARFKILS